MADLPIDPDHCTIPGVIVGSPSGLARPFTVILRDLNNHLSDAPEIWLGYDVVPPETSCNDPHASPKPYKPLGAGDVLECFDPNPNHVFIDWVYNEIDGPEGTFYPRFGGRGEMSLDVQGGLTAIPFYAGAGCVVARSTDFDADGDTDQLDKLEIGHEIKSGSPDPWYNLDTDDPNNTVINAGDYMVVVAEMLRDSPAYCSCPPGTTSPYPTCDEDPPAPVEDESPPQPTTLSVTSDAGSSITLQWESPGDDYDLGEKIGVPKAYDLRYSNSPITSGNFAGATQYTATPTPSIAGTVESVTINCIPARYWAIKTMDHADSLSTMSAVLDLATVTPISTVTACATFKTCILVGWADPSASAYELRYSTSAINESNFCSATAGGTPTVSSEIAEKRITGLAQGTTYYFAVRWKDSNNRWSGVSNVASSTTLTFGTSCNTNVHCTGDWGLEQSVAQIPVDHLDFAAPSPSPTATSATIAYAIPEELSGRKLNVTIYNVNGSRVATLVDEISQPGQFSQTWNLRDERGADVRPGVYFVRLTVGTERLLHRIIVSSR